MIQIIFFLRRLLSDFSIVLIILFITLSNVYSQNIPNVGGYLEFSYTEGNNYDFITGAPKSSSKTFLDFKLLAWNPNDRNTHLWAVLTNIPKSFSSQFIFYPRYEYDFSGRPRPYGRGSGQRSWISKYGDFNEHNPADWKKASYKWPYGGLSHTGRFYIKNLATVSLDLIESTNWKYPKQSYASFGSIQNSLYQYTWSTTSDFYRERSNVAKGSIPGRNDPKQEFFIPNQFWSNNQYAHIQALTSSIQESNPYFDVNIQTLGNGNLGLFHTYDIFIFPYIVNGQKTTFINDSPKIYNFGQQGGYSGSEATFLSFAQVKDGDQLIYRWVDGTNISESSKYSQSNNNDLLYRFTPGYSSDKPLKKDTTNDDYFYINPYSGSVNFINDNNSGLKRSWVAIDQYHDGQLISTTINQVPFISQVQSSSNNAPSITVSSSTNNIAQKTSFDFETDIPLSPDAIDAPNKIKPYVPDNTERLRVPYKEVNNNGEVLLEGLDASENEIVSFDITVTDPNNDTVTFEILPVDLGLINEYPWTLTNNGDNTYSFNWTTPADLDTETNLDSKSYMFMLYAKDDNEVLPGLPGRNLKPVSITVHKTPSVLITSIDVDSGGTTNDNSINLNITLTDIETAILSQDSFSLTEEDFALTNAILSDLTKVNNFTYSAKLTVDPELDPTINPVSTSVQIGDDKFSVTKTGGHGMNQVSLPNKSSNVFTWISNQIRPVVTYEFFDSEGEPLTHNTKTNDEYILGKISVSSTVNGFELSDVNLANLEISSSVFEKVEDVSETYFTIKINASDNKIGQSKISIPENVFYDDLSNQNLEGSLFSDSSIKEFIWDFDRIKPILTITNPFASLSSATTATTGEFTFSFNEGVKFKNKNISDLTNQDKEDLVSILNANTTNAFFTDFIFDAANPDQFKLTINHGGGNKNVSITVPEDFVQDLYGNNLATEVTSSHSFNLDFPRLNNIYSVNKTRTRRNGPFTYSQGDVLTHLKSTTPVDILVSFLGQSENPTTNQNDIGYQSETSGLSFNIIDSSIDVSSGRLSNIKYFGLGSVADGSGNLEQLYRLTYTPDSNYNGYVSFSIDAGVFSNATSVSNIFSKKQILIDNTPPTVTFKLATQYGIPLNKQDVTNEDYLLVEARFSEPVEGFEVSDLNIGNSFTHKFPTISEFTKVTDALYTFKVIHSSGDGEYSIINSALSFTDKQGIKNTQRDLFNWYYDNTGPSVEIEIYNGENVIKDQEYTANNITTVKYVFTEPGISLEDSNIVMYQLLNTHAQNITYTDADFDSENKTITAVGSINEVGQVSINLPENLFKDRGGNLNTSAPERVYYYDNSVPEPTIIISKGSSTMENNSKFNANSLNVSYEFSVVLGTTNYSDYSIFELQEILNTQISNGELTNLQKVDNDTFSGVISNFENGEIVVGFPKNLVFTESSIKNTKANNVVLYLDNIAPKATLTLSNVDGDNIEQGSNINHTTVYAQVVVTEKTTDLTLDDFSFTSNVSASNFLQVDDFTYSFELNNNASGIINIALSTNKFSDDIGNLNDEEITFSYNFDNTRPVPTISSSLLSERSSTNSTIVPVEITFSEDVFFTQPEDKLESYLGTLIVNGSISDFSKTESTIRFKINRVSNGNCSITLPENIFNDTHSNGNTEDSFNFLFEGSITLTSVTLDSDNPLEDDYTISYTSDNVNRTVPGTRSLINSGEIDFLYVNSSHNLTLNIVSEANIIITNLTIDGQTVNATNSSGDQTNWQAVYPLSSASTEGIIDFQIEFTDTNGVAQTPVSKTTDEIYFKKDFTPPVLTTKIYLDDTEIDYSNEPLLKAIHKVVLAADETIYAEKAYANVNNFQYNGSLAEFAAMMQYLDGLHTLNNYHNPEMLNNRPSSTLPLSFGYEGYFDPNTDSFTKDNTYRNGHLIVFPNTGGGSYNLTIPDNYFQDLAGNKTSGFSLGGLTLLSTGNSASVEADTEKKSCENVTKATVTRRLSYFYDLDYENTNIIVELSDNDNFNSSMTLGEERIRVLSQASNSKLPNGTIPGVEILTISYELDLEESTWVRYKVIDSLSGNRPGREDQVVTTYSDPVYITINPVTTEITGPADICRIGETESFTVNTTGGTWSVSDNTIALITTNGELTTIATGTIDVIYTTEDGCVLLKELEVFDTPQVTITANGQTTFCEGTSILISTSITDTDKIIWYKDDVAQTQLTSNSVKLNKTSDSGVYHMSYVTSCGTTISNKITIKINSLPNSSKVSSND